MVICNYGEGLTVSIRQTEIPGSHEPGLSAAMAETASLGFRTSPGPLRVAVCVDQRVGQGEEISGLARCWWEIAHAAAHVPELELTVHVLADETSRYEIAPNVRIVSHTPRFGSRNLSRVRLLKTPTHVSLYPCHAPLARELADVDVIHTTYTFLTFALTALRVSRRKQIPLVNSLHTDVPAYAEIYARDVLRGWTGYAPRWVGSMVASAMRMETLWYLKQCAHVFASTPADRKSYSTRLGHNRIHLFGRGIDRETFHPGRRDRVRLNALFGIGSNEYVLLLSGRLNKEKNPYLAARVVRRLRREGLPVRLLIAGEGELLERVLRESGGGGIAAGARSHDELGWIAASCDALIFPSPTEMYANCLVEAFSAGLPALISSKGGAIQHLSGSGDDGVIVPSDTVDCWARETRQLLQDPDRRRRMSQTARSRIDLEYGDWLDVLENQLLPVWKECARMNDE